MFDFIPIQYYTPIYYHFLLIVILITINHTLNHSGFSKNTYSFNDFSAIVIFVFTLLYMGLRPLSGIFGDMGGYHHVFNSYANGVFPIKTSDIGFYTFMKLMSYTQSSKFFFFSLSILYIIPLYIASKRWFPNYYYFAFIILIASFSFWSFGTNGLRNGIATSFMLLALSYGNNKLYKYVLFLLAYSFHSSMLLIIFAYFLSLFIKKTWIYFFSWFTSILLSVTMGTFWESFFLNLGFGKKEKLEGYFINKDLYRDSFSSTGFRWDFLLYSSIAVGIAYYFIYIKKINDKHYKQLVSIYLITNAFWILVIRASFSNRFAYLSWFMMGIIIIYPFLKQVYWKNQFSIIGYIILFYYSFTYIMNIFIY